MECVDGGLHSGPAVVASGGLRAVVVVDHPCDLAGGADELRERRLPTSRRQAVRGRVRVVVDVERPDARQKLIGDDGGDDPHVGELLGKRFVRVRGRVCVEGLRDLAELLEQPQHAGGRRPIATELRHRPADVELGDGA